MKSYFKFIFLLPNALGDSMMSIQAMSKYFYLFNEHSILIIVDGKYESLYKRIFLSKKVQVDTYENVSQNSKLFECEKIIDFNSSKNSEKILLEADCLNKYSFEFDTTRMIMHRSGNCTNKFKAVVICDEVDSDTSLKHAAWVMDAELICSAFCVPLIVVSATNEMKLEKQKIKNVLCFPCGSNNKKHWSLKNWKSLVKILKKHGLDVTIFLGSDEKNYISYFSSITTTKINMGLEEIVDLYFNIETLVISNDCGPMHVAAFFEMPLIAMFGPTDEKVWFPYTKGRALRSTEREWSTTKDVLNTIKSLYDFNT